MPALPPDYMAKIHEELARRQTRLRETIDRHTSPTAAAISKAARQETESRQFSIPKLLDRLVENGKITKDEAATVRKAGDGLSPAAAEIRMKAALLALPHESLGMAMQEALGLNGSRTTPK